MSGQFEAFVKFHPFLLCEPLELENITWFKLHLWYVFEHFAFKYVSFCNTDNHLTRQTRFGNHCLAKNMVLFGNFLENRQLYLEAIV